MASIKVKFRASTVEGKEGTLYYQVIHNRLARQIKTSYKLYSNEWREYDSSIVIGCDNTSRDVYLMRIEDKLKLDIQRVNKTIATLEQKGKPYQVDEVVDAFYHQPQGESFFSFMQKRIVRLRELSKDGTADTYATTYKSFRRFNNDGDLLFDEINSDLMLDYEAHLKRHNVSLNSISFYMRILRAVYNYAVKKGVTMQQNPFDEVYTSIDKTAKRAVQIKSIKKIKELDTTKNIAMTLAKDMFMFSFYTRGMSFVDMAYLRRSDLKNGVLSYRRRKTGQLLHIKWEQCMQDIVDRYASSDDVYMLPIISTTESTEIARKEYKNRLKQINNQLKKIASMVDITIPLTMYVARHSWASVAKSKNVPISVISEGMGHDSETTTQIYLASLDTSVVDKANSLILKSI